MTLRKRLLAWAERLVIQRPPDFIVGDRQLERWWLIPRNNLFNVYLHRFRSSDEDRALHDHMYVNLSWILGPGGYVEVVPANPRRPDQPAVVRIGRAAGEVVWRLPSAAHRIELPPGSAPVWSLFITGPRVRQWGFWCPQGWRHWKEFTLAGQPGQRGKGCEL